jgi:hypothetical protein
VALGVQIAWVVGWTVGGLVVVIAAVLLLLIIGLGQRIVGQAKEITGLLDSARQRTIPLFELSQTNLALDRMVRGLARAREEQAR